LLCGDRNITNRASAGGRLVSLTKGATIAWTKELHSKQGILLFWDGSVKEVTNGAVGDAIRIPDGVTNRLAIP
jgi:prepilin-type processing-associated H-X9-DG protein